MNLSLGRACALAALLASSSLVAACASVPDLGAAPMVRPAESYAAAKSLEAPGAEWPQDAWWAAYGDAQLGGLIDEALKGSPTMAVAAARVGRAEALAQQAGAALKPQASGSLSASAAYIDTGKLLGSSGPSGIQTNGYGFLNLSFDFDLWGRNRAALAAATSEAEAARTDAAQARLTLSTSVAAAYADLAQLYSSLDAANEAVTVRRRSLELIQQRQVNGLENNGAVQQAEAGRAQAQAEVASIEEAVALNKNRIAALIGGGPDRALSIARPAIAAPKAFGLPAELQTELLGRRPDIVAARLRAEASASRTKQAKAGFYPNVNLTALAGAASLDLSSLSSSTLGGATIGPAISLPIFDAGRLQGQYRAAWADHQAAVAEYDRTLNQALQEVADVAVSERALATRLANTRAALAASEQAHRIARDRYDGGLSSYLEVLRAEDSLIANRRAVADLQTRAFFLDVALVRALGGGFTAGKV
jgi:NodT family efflux transporter outer membrane factor (OMF) lipoprotein